MKNWVVKNLVDCVDPRMHGKPLKGNLKGVWRYRVGDYRLFADIQDDKLVIFLFEVAHRKEIYK
ncbi:MAG: type II toxin-antitoxin system RelE/ParE family toxin [Veillonella sp.]|nr:type II toxin-antitoxin system RelE/ParE family toxin [Veillonella sp.]